MNYVPLDAFSKFLYLSRPEKTSSSRPKQILGETNESEHMLGLFLTDDLCVKVALELNYGGEKVEKFYLSSIYLQVFAYSIQVTSDCDSLKF